MAEGVRGAVDNVDAGRLFGWAWEPARPAMRVAIELRLGAEVVARTCADAPRADLRDAGIGDGRHAFDLPLTPALIARRSEIFVVAIGSDGAPVPLPILGARRAVAPVPGEGDGMARALRALAAEQAALRSRLDAAEATPPATQAVVDAMGARLAVLERSCLRFDEGLAQLGRVPPPAPRRIDAWQLVLGAVALIALFGGLLATRMGSLAAGGGG